MAKNIDKQIIDNVKRYVANVSTDYNVESAFLFGSYAKGTQKNDSDIDVAVVIKNIDNRILVTGKLYGYNHGIDTRIEPHVIGLDEYINRDSMIAREIVKSGIRIV